MILPDVNVLVYAFKSGVKEHSDYRSWMVDALQGPHPLGLSELVLSGVMRVVTHPRVFDVPSSPEEALGYVEALRSAPTSIVISPGPRHWTIFADLVQASRPRGGLVSDAYHAALAIEHGCEWVTTDRDFARFPGLQWRHPLQGDGRPQ